MESNKIRLLLMIILLVASTTLITKLTYAESAPSAPEFTAQYVDNSYNIPPTYGTDPYTGQTIITSPGSHVDNQTIVVTIQNQPFTPYQDSQNGTTIQLYYNIRSKGHFENFTSDTDLGSNGLSGVAASSSATTVVYFDIANWGVTVGGQIDFQVQAFIGYTYYNEQECFTANVVTVGESSWSNIVTVTVGSSTTTTSRFSPTPTPYPIQTQTVVPTTAPIQPSEQKGVLPAFNVEQIALIVMAVTIAVLASVLIAVIKMRKVPAK
jgi:hypothetical protein